MNEDVLNMSVRKFLKKVGVTAQREIELGVREVIESGGLKGNEKLPARAVVRVEGLGREIEIEGEIALA